MVWAIIKDNELILTIFNKTRNHKDMENMVKEGNATFVF